MVHAGTDPYGNDELTAVHVTVPAHVQTRGTTAKPSQSLRRSPVTMHVPADVAVLDGDEITWCGRALRAMGDAAYQLDLFTGRPVYGEVELEAVS
ncbi:hypothetical protein [Actinomadura rayongensis]|uniref:Uncharacterized protein n=1 Tax=Actinomadura rayongensis TaxID=1429076 RepID=A0A6I4WDG0_9ACTN|nr:hypothetical protein [Actinomadura rayongensis]MXQ67701.1 hypothetical protein [Actinomadura rayongensis]